MPLQTKRLTTSFERERERDPERERDRNRANVGQTRIPIRGGGPAAENGLRGGGLFYVSYGAVETGPPRKQTRPLSRLDC